MNNETESAAGTAKLSLRPEARPTIYEVLDRQQKDAFGRIIKFIAEAIDGIGGAARSSRSAETIGTASQLPPWLDQRSTTRMAFLHGHRGMGKTTVMLSVLSARYWDDKYPVELGEAVQKLRTRTVWLEPIAMEPLPSSANLLAAVLARIDAAVQERVWATGEGTGDPTARGRGGAYALMSDQERALLQFQRLQTDVAVAWDGNLPVRSGQLDPDTYAVELLRVERSRLSLKHELSVTLDALAAAFYPAAAPVSNPLFVLPIDDVDLDPLRCLEMLKLLRLVPVPRLFALVLGNIRIVDLVLNLQYSNEFASAYKSRFLKQLSVDSSEVAGLAAEAAGNAVAKLIPLAQRIVLEHMTVRESFNFKPLVPDSHRLPMLHELLAKLDLNFPKWQTPKGETIPGRPKDLRQFALHTGTYEREITDDDVSKKAHYFARYLMKAPPRRIADWWFDLLRLRDRVDSINKDDKATNGDQAKKDEKIHREVVYAVGRICYWAISEDHMLPTRQRSIYRRALRINPAGFWELVEPLNSIPDINRAYILFDLRSRVAEHPWNSIQPSPRVVINYGTGWYLRPTETRTLHPPAIVDLEKTPDYAFVSGITMPRFHEDSTYAVILLHDLLGLGPESEIMTQSVQINRPYERWAATIWEGGWISWPVPAFWSYWEFDLFVFYWKRVVEACQEVSIENSIEKTLEPLVYGWIDACQAVWRGEEPFSLREANALPWDDLAQKVAALSKATTGGIKGAKLKEWLLRLPFFLGPAVTGISRDIVKAFIRQGELATKWEQSADVINGYHLEIIKHFKGKGMDKLVGDLDDAWKKHLDVLYPKGNPSSPPSSKRTARKAVRAGRSKRTSGRLSPKQGGRA